MNIYLRKFWFEASNSLYNSFSGLSKIRRRSCNIDIKPRYTKLIRNKLNNIPQDDIEKLLENTVIDII